MTEQQKKARRIVADNKKKIAEQTTHDAPAEYYIADPTSEKSKDAVLCAAIEVLCKQGHAFYDTSLDVPMFLGRPAEEYAVISELSSRLECAAPKKSWQYFNAIVRKHQRNTLAARLEQMYAMTAPTDMKLSDFHGIITHRHKGDDELSDLVLWCFFTGCIARRCFAQQLDVGIDLPIMPVITGAEGIGKSAFWRTLFSDPISGVFGGQWRRSFDPFTNKREGYIAGRGAAALDIDEMTGFTRHDEQSVKQMITATEDTYRPLYAGDAITIRRSYGICGTSNNSQLLTSTTGNRRPFIIEAESIDVGELMRRHKTLWAVAFNEVRKYVGAGGRFEFGDANQPQLLPQESVAKMQKRNTAFIEGTPIDDKVSDLVGTMYEKGKGIPFSQAYNAIFGDQSPYHPFYPRMLVRAFASIGWKEVKKIGADNKTRRRFFVPREK